jgi:hypothetical protein
MIDWAKKYIYATMNKTIEDFDFAKNTITVKSEDKYAEFKVAADKYEAFNHDKKISK